MNFTQKLGILCLVIITSLYVYFSFFSEEGFNINFPKKETDIEISTDEPIENNDQETVDKKEIKIVKIFVTDAKGNIRPVSRKCDTSKEKSCFTFAIKELISAPTKWEKSKGLSSEIPTDTRVLSVREGSNNILIDLSSNFESGGGAESTYIRVHQLIKTVQANTKQPVYLYLNGKQADVIGGEGIMIKQPLDERSLDD